MITIKEKSNCCGCEACVQICPKECISLVADSREGFLYPEVQTDLCINCGLCEKVCPMSNNAICSNESLIKEKAYAFIHLDEEIRMQSSSGGFFSAIANQILDDGGIVFGVRYDNKWMPVYDYFVEKGEIEKYRGSKYVQAFVGTAYKDAERFLKEGKKVLFTGTSCHIKALNLFLKKKYSNLYTVDFICHGVPSPAVWKYYLFNLNQKRTADDKREPIIKSVSFRDKQKGWKNFSIVLTNSSYDSIINQSHRENPYMRAFLSNLSIRPSCYNCQSKSGRSMSDITMADAWGINRSNPEMDDDKGTSLVIAHSDKGLQLIQSIKNCKKKEINVFDGLLCNPSYRKSSEYNKKRSDFFDVYQSTENWDEMTLRLTPTPSVIVLIMATIKGLIKMVLHKINIV